MAAGSRSAHRPSMGSRGALGPRSDGARQRSRVELVPERGGNWRLKHAHVLFDFANRSAAREHRRDGGMAQRELDRRRLQLDTMAGAELLHAERALHELGRRLLVIEGRSRAGIRQDAAVEYAAGDDRDALLDAKRQQLGRAAAIEQRVATRK